MLGGEVSTWSRFDEPHFARNGKFWDLIYTAQMLWNEQYDERLRPVYTHLLAEKVQPLIRSELHGLPRSLSSAALQEIALPVGNQADIPVGILEKYPSAVRADGICIPVGRRCGRLIFSHTTLWNLPRVAFKDSPLIGSYTVRYTDGQTVEIPLEYNSHIQAWNRRYAQPLPQQYYRHVGYVGTWWSDPVYEGKTAEGGDVLVTGLVWDNPRPDAEIASVSFRAAESDVSVPVLACLQGI